MISLPYYGGLMPASPLHPYYYFGNLPLESPPSKLDMGESLITPEFSAAWERGATERRKLGWYLENRPRWREVLSQYLAESGDPSSGPLAEPWQSDEILDFDDSFVLGALPPDERVLPYREYLTVAEHVGDWKNLSTRLYRLRILVAPPELLCVAAAMPLFSVEGWYAHPLFQDFMQCARVAGYPEPLVFDAGLEERLPAPRIRQIRETMKRYGVRHSLLQEYRRAVLLGSAGRPARRQYASLQPVPGDPYRRSGAPYLSTNALYSSAYAQADVAWAERHIPKLQQKEVRSITDRTAVIVEVVQC